MSDGLVTAATAATELVEEDVLEITAPPRAPMPIAWSRWRDLPSVCSAGATISSARLNSAMSW